MIIPFHKILRLLFIVFFLLILADILVLLLKFKFGHDNVFGFIPLFDFDRERSIPALFTTLLFLFAALQMFMNAGLKSQTFTFRWKLLGFLFVYCGIDEFCSIHERFSFPMQQLLHTSGIFYFGWVIPYSIVGLGLLLYFLPLFASLPLYVNKWLTAAFLVFFSGAVGLEMIGGCWFEHVGEKADLLYSVFVLYEESFEILGLLLFCNGIGKYFKHNQSFMTIKY